MSDIRFLRPVARWLSILMLAGVLWPRVPARAADAGAAAPAATLTSGVVVLDATADFITLSAGEKQGVTPGTLFRIVRNGEEVSRVKVTEVSFATARAQVVSGLPAGQLRVNDRAEMVGTPAPKARARGHFPWLALVGAGVVALVVLGATHDKKSAAASAGSADISIK